MASLRTINSYRTFKSIFRRTMRVITIYPKCDGKVKKKMSAKMKKWQTYSCVTLNLHFLHTLVHL